MIEIINHRTSKAKKQYRCNYCNCIIKPGEEYNRDFLKDGGSTYEWKAHKRCQFIAEELWDYIDPDEGMDDDSFCNGAHEFASTFVCPFCPNFDKEEKICKDEKWITHEDFCMNRIKNCLERNRLILRKGEDGWLYYMLEKKVENKENQ